MAKLRVESEIVEMIEEKIRMLDHYKKVRNEDMAKCIATQLVVLHWVIGLDGYQFYQPYDDIPF